MHQNTDRAKTSTPYRNIGNAGPKGQLVLKVYIILYGNKPKEKLSKF